MSRAWKPGDVARRKTAARIGDYESVALATTCANSIHGSGLHWHHVGGGWDPLDVADGPTYRPLVVIDPEDREQVERLRVALVGNYVDDDDLFGLVEGLREFANPTPPKPDEPMGLGAVVEDASGANWIRAGRIKHGWHRPMGVWGAYEDISAVRVLSEGVTP